MGRRFNDFLKRRLQPLMKVLGPLIADDSIHRMRTYGDKSRLTIAPTAVVNDATFNLMSGRIVIEENVFFGMRVSVYTGTHDMTLFDNERLMLIQHDGRDVIIKRGAWIGSQAILLGPVTIGEHAVVGAGSVVGRDVPPYTLVAGNPARVIRDVRESKPPVGPTT